MGRSTTCLILAVVIAAFSVSVQAAGNKWETNAASENAASQGLEWLAKNQGKEGNWGSQDLGLVAVGALAFLSDGNTPETGKYRENVRKALDYILANAKPSGMLNITGDRRDMYNHGLATFVLTQAYGMSNDKRLGRTLRKAVKLIVDVQCKDGGWDYVGARQDKGHDLSLAVMQAKALRGSMDIGIHIPSDTIAMAIKSVQGYYRSKRGKADKLADKYGWKQEDARYPGRFTYNGGSGTTAMAAAGAVCLQEFGQYGDYRIRRSINGVLDDIKKRMKKTPGRMPFDAYTMYYVAQGLYQVGGDLWVEGYPLIRDAIVETQVRKSAKGGAAVEDYGSWSGSRVGGTPGKMFATAVAVFSLNIPNRYLPILQEGKHGRTRRRSPRAFHKGDTNDTNDTNDKSDKKTPEPRSVKYAADAGRTIKLAIKSKSAVTPGSELDSKKRKALTK